MPPLIPGSPFQIRASTPVIATPSSNGTNHVEWNKIDRTGIDYVAFYLQRSSVDNQIPFYPLYTQVVNSAGVYTDSFWSTIKTWNNADIILGSEPSSYDDPNIPHSTFYYYRGVYEFRHSGTSPPYLQVSSAIATIVQPFQLCICNPVSGACQTTIPQGCTPRLTWDAPKFTVDFITGSHVPPCTPSATNGCYKIVVNYPYVPAATYDVYKSTVGPDSLVRVVVNASLNGSNEWYDSDSAHAIWYQFRAIRPNNSVIISNTVALSY